MIDIRGNTVDNNDIYLGIEYNPKPNSIKSIKVNIQEEFDLQSLVDLIVRLDNIKDSMVNMIEQECKEANEVIDELNDDKSDEIDEYNTFDYE